MKKCCILLLLTTQFCIALDLSNRTGKGVFTQTIVTRESRLLVPSAQEGQRAIPEPRAVIAKRGQGMLKLWLSYTAFEAKDSTVYAMPIGNFLDINRSRKQFNIVNSALATPVIEPLAEFEQKKSGPDEQKNVWHDDEPGSPCAIPAHIEQLAARHDELKHLREQLELEKKAHRELQDKYAALEAMLSKKL